MALRDEVDDHLDWGYTEDVKAGLAKIKELIDSAMIEDNMMVMDKLSVYEYLADCYKNIRLFDESLTCYRVALNLAEGLVDSNRTALDGLDEIFEKYIITRYMADGNQSEDLEDELFNYLDHGEKFRKKVLKRIKE